VEVFTISLIVFQTLSSFFFIGDRGGNFYMLITANKNDFENQLILPAVTLNNKNKKTTKIHEKSNSFSVQQ
jgi:hypothetical protein